MLSRIKSVIKTKIAFTTHKDQEFSGNDHKGGKQVPTVPLSWAKGNTDKSNKLQLQQEIKKSKEAHANIYCWAWKKATGDDCQTQKSLPPKSHESEFSNQTSKISSPKV